MNHIQYPADNSADTAAAQSAESLHSQSLQAPLFSEEEMEALKVYFDRYDQNMFPVFRNGPSSQERLYSCLLDRFEKSKFLLSHLELPWDRYIPILHRAFCLYFINTPETKLRQQALYLSSELMSAIVLLSQHGPLINHLAFYFHKEAERLKKWMEEYEKKTLQQESSI